MSNSEKQINKSQLLKGILEPCILKIIDNEEVYGYDITERLNEVGLTDITLGTIYPLLLRLEKQKLISSYNKKSKIGPDRKYYEITIAGKIYLNEFIQKWNVLSKSVDNIINSK